jgi:hypothetical protein
MLENWQSESLGRIAGLTQGDDSILLDFTVGLGGTSTLGVSGAKLDSENELK